MYECMVITYSNGMNQPGKVANRARGQLDKKNEYFAAPLHAREFVLTRRVRQFRPASACSTSILRLNLVLTYGVAYRWRSLPRVRRHRTGKSQGSSKRVLPWQATMDQIICASLSHTHYWYEVVTAC